MNQNSVAHQDGLLVITCVGTLDEKSSPAIFGNILKYAKEAPQVAVFDLSLVEGIKTAFITGILEVTKYLQNNGGTSLVIPGKMGDILEITGIKAATHSVSSLDEAKSYTREHFPQVIDFIREQEQKQKIAHATQGQTVDAKTWKFFTDPEKKEVSIENILKYALLSRASDVHISGGKPIAFRIE